MSGHDSRAVTMRERIVLLAGATLWIALTGRLDYLTGIEYRLFPLYFLPICLVGWRLGHLPTFLAAWFSTVTWFAANYLGGLTFSTSNVWVVNFITQGLSFSIVGWLVVVARRAYWLAETRSRTDSLTSLLNGRAFTDEAVRTTALCERNRRPVTVAYLDVDDFKQVNDRFGHARGDEVLAMVASVLRAAGRETDLVARIGGDEFALLLADTDEAGARIVLDRVRSNLAEAFREGNGGVTVSIGAIVSPSGHPPVDEMLRQADALLYQAKERGKNRWVSAVRGTAPAA